MKDIVSEDSTNIFVEHTYSQEHADQLCNLVCGSYKGDTSYCQENCKRGCWSWSSIDSFKRILLAHRYSRTK